jgi:predicted NAD/FAD-dependent oxidoreductase
MVIGIIGASISGLIAGKRLADKGHDVTVIEKSRSLGGRLATTRLDDIDLDYGISHFAANTQTFQTFVNELKTQGEVKGWVDEFGLYDGTEFHKIDPNSDPQLHYVGTGGNQSIAKNLSRWLDFITKEKAGGLTYIGPDRSKKRSWMINLTDTSVFECDAVLLATPAVESDGVIQTVQNRTVMRRIIRHIDEVRYKGCMSLAVTFDREVPDWKGIACERSNIRWIGNESSKREGVEKTGLLIQSSGDFYRKHAQDSDEKIQKLLLEGASKIAGNWIQQPKSSFVHRWNYFEAENPINEYFMELEMDEAPLALIGDYLGGNSLEDAFVSGYNLAEYWIKKYDVVTA